MWAGAWHTTGFMSPPDLTDGLGGPRESATGGFANVAKCGQFHGVWGRGMVLDVGGVGMTMDGGRHLNCQCSVGVLLGKECHVYMLYPLPQTHPLRGLHLCLSSRGKRVVTASTFVGKGLLPLVFVGGGL